MQPCMGTREFPAYYEWGSSGDEPIDESEDFGLMVYDVFDLNRREISKKTESSVSLFNAKMVHGVIEIPPYNSPLVLKPEGR